MYFKTFILINLINKTLTYNVKEAEVEVIAS